MAANEIAGFDCSFTKPPAVPAAAAGFRFVFGYVSGNPGHDLSKEQAADYVAAGLAVGLFWETLPKRAAAGAGAGAADGTHADAQADAIGYPADAALFFTVDWDAQPAEYSTIRAYGQAFAAATKRPVGMYAGHDVLEALVTPDQPPIRYGFQAGGWGHGAGLSGKAHFLQRVGHVNWPATIGDAGPAAFDEDVLCIPGVPLMAGAAAPSAPEPAAPPAPAPAADDGPYIPPTGHDLTGDGDSLHGHIGDAGPRVAELQHELNADFPAYSHLPETGFYGHQTADVLEEFGHRAAVEAETPAADRDGLRTSDGEDIGPRTAHALHRHGLI